MGPEGSAEPPPSGWELSAVPPTDADAAVELARVVTRLRTMPLARLSAPWPPHPSRAAAARALAQDMAARAAAVSGGAWRALPDVGDAAVGDQVAVTGRDLLDVDPPAVDREWMAGRLRELRLSL